MAYGQAGRSGASAINETSAHAASVNTRLALGVLHGRRRSRCQSSSRMTASSTLTNRVA
jgi:hypothetical protein